MSLADLQGWLVTIGAYLAIIAVAALLARYVLLPGLQQQADVPRVVQEAERIASEAWKRERVE